MQLTNEDTYLEEETSIGAAPSVQTSSLGSKQFAVRWLPTCCQPDPSQPVAVAGTWDEPQNEIALWSVRFSSDFPAKDENMLDVAEESQSVPKQVCCVPHDGCVLDLSVGRSSAGSPVVFSASGTGCITCFCIEGGVTGAANASIEALTLKQQWAVPTAGKGFAALGVSWSAEEQRLAAVNEDGALVLLDDSRGCRLDVGHSHETSLFGLSWQAPHQLLTAGNSVLIWDIRTKLAPKLRLEPQPGAAAHLAPQMHCVSVHPAKPNLLTSGSADGDLFLWDMRRAEKHTAVARVQAHSSDVWGVHLGETGYGDLLSCSSDGTLQAWRLDNILSLDGGADDPAPFLPPYNEQGSRVLVQLGLPVNAFDVCDLGALVAASDAQVLTFIDLRR